MNEIKLNFKQYKKLRDNEIDLSDSNIMLVQGPNDAGKSTVLQGLVSLLTGKELAPEPVTKGFDKGEKTLEITAFDGKRYTIIHEFTNEKSKFYAIDENGKKIDKITDFRNIFKYTHFTAEEFIAMSNTAEGRRKQLELLLNVLSEEDRNAYRTQEAYEDKYYKERTDNGKAMETWGNEVKAINITNEDKDLYSKKDAINITFNELKAEKDKLIIIKTNASTIADKYNALLENIANIELELSNLPLETQTSIDGINTEISQLEALIATKKAQIQSLQDKERTTTITLNEKLSNLNKEKETYDNNDKVDVDVKITEIDGRLLKSQEVINKLTYIEKNYDKYNNAKEKLDAFIVAYNESERLLNEARTNKKDIITKSDLSKFNIKFEEGFLYVDDFKFDSNQICTSKVYKLVARIMMSINKDCPILIMGKGSELDNNSLDELYDLAEANGRIMVYDEVDRTKNELVVVGYTKSKGKEVKKDTVQTSLF